MSRIPGFEEFCVSYSRKIASQERPEIAFKETGMARAIEIGENLVKDSFIGLEDLWKRLMISQHSKMKFLK